MTDSHKKNSNIEKIRIQDIKIGGDWSEREIIQVVQEKLKSDAFRIGGSSFCYKIIKRLCREDELIENIGHDCSPPDYYSDALDIMFDVMRVNDSECRRHNNPVFREMSMIKKEAAKKINTLGLSDAYAVMPFLNTDESIGYDKVHKFSYYRKHVSRVVSEHIRKIPIWCKEHPKIKYKGLMILDEAGIYFKGKVLPKVEEDGSIYWYYIVQKPLIVHYPWLDEFLMAPIINSNLDFVIWFHPYTEESILNTKFLNREYPALIVIDVRHKLNGMKLYEESDDWTSSS